MRRRVAALVAGSIWILALGIVAVFLVYGVLNPGTSGNGNVADDAAYGAFLLAFSGVGAVLGAKRPGHPIGWLLLAAVLGYAVGGVGSSVGTPDPAAGISVDVVLAWASGWSWGLGLGFAVLVILLFPDGRLPSRRWWPALALAVGGMTAFVLGAGFGSPVIADGPAPNPFAVHGPVGDVLEALQAAFPLVLLSGLLAVASVIARFRRAHAVEREQLKWLLYAVGLVGLGLVAQVPISFALPDGPANDLRNAVITATFALVPVAIGIAVLRYRLYEIDVVIERTLVYAVLTAVLGAVYVAAVIASESILAPITAGNEIAVAASTLLVVALFQPVRSRIQGVVDQRFYRSRYDAARTLDAFAARLRDEVDLDMLRGDLLGVAGEALHPASASVWLRRGGRP